jgi:hypothetical protein
MRIAQILDRTGGWEAYVARSKKMSRGTVDR